MEVVRARGFERLRTAPRKAGLEENLSKPGSSQERNSRGDSSGSACWAGLKYVVVNQLCHLCRGGKRSNRQYRNGNRLHEQAGKPWNKDVKKV